MSLANHLTFLKKSNISWHLGTVSGAGWISWDFHLPNFQVTYRLSSFGQLFISGRLKQKPPPKKTQEMEGFTPPNSRAGGWSNNQNDLMDHIFFFLENDDSMDPFVETSIPRKRLTGWNLKNKGGLKVEIFFSRFLHLANINRPFNFSGGSQ